MKKTIVLISALAVIALTFMGCERLGNDVNNIKDLLAASYFTGDASDGVTDDGTSNPNGSPGVNIAMAPDTAPFAWVRLITSFTREVEVSVEGDSAFAKVYSYLAGRIYIDTIPGNGVADTISRPIADSVYREVVLSKGGGRLYDGWKIEKITPAKLWTFGVGHPVEIEKVDVVSTSGVNFSFEPGVFYSREDLPRFIPEDTVTVTVHARNLNDADSGWCYLHHGRHFRNSNVPRRKPFTKQDAWTFVGTWLIQDENIIHTPTVRHAGMDLIYWETLSHDPAAEYSSYALGMPYLVAEPDDVLPDDGDDTNE